MYDPFLFGKIELPPNSFWCETLEELLAVSDYVTLHMPLLPETKGLINERTLRLMKPTAYLINCARGGIVVEEDLIKALNGDVIAGAGIDVLEVEPPEANHPYFGVRNMILTPHSATATAEANLNLSMACVENIRKVFNGEIPDAAVNRKQLNL